MNLEWGFFFMKPTVFIIIIYTCLIACVSKPEEPEGLYNKEEMVNIIVQLEVNQAIYKLKFTTNDSLDFDKLTQHTFENLNATKENFNASLAYYASTPKILEEIYNQAIVNLAQKQAELQSNDDRSKE